MATRPSDPFAALDAALGSGQDKTEPEKPTRETKDPFALLDEATANVPGLPDRQYTPGPQTELPAPTTPSTAVPDTVAPPDTAGMHEEASPFGPGAMPREGTTHDTRTAWYARLAHALFTGSPPLDPTVDVHHQLPPDVAGRVPGQIADVARQGMRGLSEAGTNLIKAVAGPENGPEQQTLFVHGAGRVELPTAGPPARRATDLAAMKAAATYGEPKTAAGAVARAGGRFGGELALSGAAGGLAASVEAPWLVGSVAASLPFAISAAESRDQSTIGALAHLTGSEALSRLADIPGVRAAAEVGLLAGTEGLLHAITNRLKAVDAAPGTTYGLDELERVAASVEHEYSQLPNSVRDRLRNIGHGALDRELEQQAASVEYSQLPNSVRDRLRNIGHGALDRELEQRAGTVGRVRAVSEGVGRMGGRPEGLPTTAGGRLRTAQEAAAELTRPGTPLRSASDITDYSRGRMELTPTESPQNAPEAPRGPGVPLGPPEPPEAPGAPVPYASEASGAAGATSEPRPPAYARRAATRLAGEAPAPEPSTPSFVDRARKRLSGLYPPRETTFGGMLRGERTRIVKEGISDLPAGENPRGLTWGYKAEGLYEASDGSQVVKKGDSTFRALAKKPDGSLLHIGDYPSATEAQNAIEASRAAHARAEGKGLPEQEAAHVSRSPNRELQAAYHDGTHSITKEDVPPDTPRAALHLNQDVRGIAQASGVHPDRVDDAFHDVLAGVGPNNMRPRTTSVLEWRDRFVEEASRYLDRVNSSLAGPVSTARIADNARELDPVRRYSGAQNYAETAEKNLKQARTASEHLRNQADVLDGLGATEAAAKSRARADEIVQPFDDAAKAADYEVQRASDAVEARKEAVAALPQTRAAMVRTVSELRLNGREFKYNLSGDPDLVTDGTMVIWKDQVKPGSAKRYAKLESKEGAVKHDKKTLASVFDPAFGKDISRDRADLAGFVPKGEESGFKKNRAVFVTEDGAQHQIDADKLRFVSSYVDWDRAYVTHPKSGDFVGVLLEKDGKPGAFIMGLRQTADDAVDVTKIDRGAEAGFTRLGLTARMSGAGIGAAIGGSTGKTKEDHIRNAILLGLGGALGADVVMKLIRAVRADPEATQMVSKGDELERQFQELEARVARGRAAGAGRSPEDFLRTRTQLSAEDEAAARLAKKVVPGMNLDPVAERMMQEEVRRGTAAVGITKRVVPMSEVEAQARRIGQNGKKLARILGKKNLSGPEQLALINAFRTNTRDGLMPLRALLERGATADGAKLTETQTAALEQEIGQRVKLNNALIGTWTEAGTYHARALRARQAEVFDTSDPWALLGLARDVKGKDLTEQEHIRILDLLNTGHPEKVGAEIRKLAARTPLDRNIATIKGFMLTNPATAAVITASNITRTVAMQLWEKRAAAGFDRIIAGYRSHITGESPLEARTTFAPDFRAFRRGLGEIKGEGGKMYRGEPGILTEQTRQAWAGRRVNWLEPGDTFANKPIRWVVDKTVNGVFSTVAAAHSVFRLPEYEQSLGELARVIAAREKFAEGSAEYLERVRFLEDNPTAWMQSAALHRSARDFFLRSTGVWNRLERLTKYAKYRSGPGVRVLTETTVPFNTVMFGLADQLTDLTGLGVFRGAYDVLKLRKFLKANGVFEGLPLEEVEAIQRGLDAIQEEAAQHLARGSTGFLGGMTLGWILGHNGRIVTSYPENSREQAQWHAENRRENTILIRGKWRSLDMLGPYGLTLAMGAAVRNVMTSDEPGPAWEKAVNSVGAIATTLGDMTIGQGIQTIGRVAEGQPGAFGRLAEAPVKALVPNIIQHAAHVADPTKRVAATPRERFLRNLPLYSKGLPAQIDPLTGNPVRMTHGGPLNAAGIWSQMFSPTRGAVTDPRPYDPVRQRVDDLHTYPLPPTRPKGVSQEDWERVQNHYEQKFGRQMHFVASRIINSPGFNSLSRSDQKAALERAWETAKTALKDQMAIDLLRQGKMDPAQAPKRVQDLMGRLGLRPVTGGVR